MPGCYQRLPSGRDPVEAMKKTKRLYRYFLSIGIIIALLVYFRSFIFDTIIEPLALVCWAVIRLVLFVDQAVWWGALIFITVFLSIRFISSKPGLYRQSARYENPGSGHGEDRVDAWKGKIRAAARKDSDMEALKHDLLALITATLSLKEKKEASQVKEALLKGEIRLPDRVYAFLFSGNQATRNASLISLAGLRLERRRWAARVLGGDRNEAYRAIDEMIGWMESTLEMNHEE